MNFGNQLQGLVPVGSIEVSRTSLGPSLVVF